MTPRPAPLVPAPALAAVLAALAALAGPVSPHLLSAQEAPAPRADASALVKQARERQRVFERFRQSRIPVQPDREGGGCDAQIGRICIWFGGELEAAFPREADEVTVARRELLQVLAQVGAQVADPWILGQRVHYLVESRAPGEAERTARACGIAETWWCSALLGYVLHVRGDWPGAEAAFREAAAGLPKKERERWLTGRYVLTGDGEKALGKGAQEEAERRRELFWRLSDPLFLVDGNDRLTDHFARWVEAKNQEDAENPQGLLWDDDLEETLVRYGRMAGYSRTQSPHPGMRPGGGFSVVDTRQVVGHHHPRSRGYVFPEEFLPSPADIPPESWITAPREAREWYAPPYAPDFRGLETQVGRFRRGEEMLVVGAYRPSLAPVVADAPSPRRGMRPGEPPSAVPAPTPADPVRGPVQTGLFLVPEDGGPTVEVRSTEPEGVITLLAPPGRYVSSLEVLDAPRQRAWRARQGVKQVALVPGVVALSDLLILEEGASLPATLDEALPHVRPGVRVRLGERFAVVWEVYGLGVAQKPVVTLGFTKGRPGFLARVGRLAGIIEPERPVEITFEDAPQDVVQTAFRAVTLQLPDLEPGEYTLHLRLELPGREPAVVSRPIVVEG
ncbi:MAG TPA: hypothetical protein VLH75_16130 [Longimicrobiales bacterium]|nr:hypothetical protein [Longimicrobiales bacterium]